MTNDICVITSYFNPCHYLTRKLNFDLFAARLKATGANLIVIEMALDGHAFELGEDDEPLRVRGSGMLWQKERLLNLAIRKLPSSCTKVVWIDCDVVFEYEQWLEDTSAALDRFMVVQPYSNCVHLERSRSRRQGGETSIESFAAAFARDPSLARDAAYQAHGHTGFAWAARRELLDAYGLYDACLTGSGDHLMAHVFAGTSSSSCIPAMIGSGHAYAAHFARWAAEVERFAGGRLGHVPGCVLHLWHGDRADRRYREHNQEFKRFAFDPDRHIRCDENGLWNWADAPSAMRAWAREMFVSRNEDGERGPGA
ncbi:hypothetical protein [Corallococcus caeni]|uniref:hypothetical protein n=1 Tax=Corallococcus caeni TaxID=3082388 RepID=UPI0030C6957F